MAKIVIISDTHNKHNLITIPECDILIHCGDATNRGEERELRPFISEWLAEQPARHKLFIPGNHDFDIEYNYKFWKNYCDEWGILLLHNEGAVVDGLKVYGTADQPIFFDWAFNKSFTQRECSFSNIPEGLDILITHSPPLGVLDMVHYASGEPKMAVGCPILWKHVVRTAPKIHCFGHIHSSYGYKEIGATKFYNAAICDEMYHPSNDPWVFEI